MKIYTKFGKFCFSRRRSPALIKELPRGMIVECLRRALSSCRCFTSLLLPPWCFWHSEKIRAPEHRIILISRTIHIKGYDKVVFIIQISKQHHHTTPKAVTESLPREPLFNEDFHRPRANLCTKQLRCCNCHLCCPFWSSFSCTYTFLKVFITMLLALFSWQVIVFLVVYECSNCLCRIPYLYNWRGMRRIHWPRLSVLYWRLLWSRSAGMCTLSL